MFVRCLNFFRKFAPPAGLAVLFLIARGSALSAELIQASKPAQKPETQEKKSILNFRAYRPSDSISASPSINSQMPAPVIPSPAAPPARTSRQSQELLDRQKNWIFVSPEDEKKAGSGNDILGIDEMAIDGTKSVVTKFLENRQFNDAKIGANQKGEREPRTETGNLPGFGVWNEKPNRSANSLQQDSFEKKFNEPAARELSLSGLWKEQNSPNSDKMREEKRIQMNEFRSLFSSQSASPSGQNNFGLQPENPLTSGGNSFNSRNLAPYKSPETTRNLPRAISGASVPASPSINTRVFGPSAAPAPAPERPRFVPQPSVLPVPKRRI